MNGNFDADRIHVDGNVYLRDSRFRGQVELRGAKVLGQLAMSGSTFDRAVLAATLYVEGPLVLGPGLSRSATFKSRLDLSGATIDGDLVMNRALLEGEVLANGLRIGRSMLVREAELRDRVVLHFADVSKNLDLRGTTLTRLELSGARVTQELRLVQMKWAALRNQEPILLLRNTVVGTLFDDKASWPPALDMDGFIYERLGGFEDSPAVRAGSDVIVAHRDVVWWKEWLRKDPMYNSQPYTHLAAVLASHGNREAAADIRYAGLERAREHEWSQGRWDNWFTSWLLAWTVGHGLGDYAFRAVAWVVGFTALGALILAGFVPAARRRGGWWCAGASLNRLLPVVQLNKEFEDFFHDPQRERMTGWQLAYFAVHGLVGWAFGLFLVAALTGVMQR